MGVNDNIILIILKLSRQSHSYYVRKFFASVGRIFNAVCVVAFFVNIGLYVFGHVSNDFELKILSIANMLLLSFVLLRETKQKSE